MSLAPRVSGLKRFVPQPRSTLVPETLGPYSILMHCDLGFELLYTRKAISNHPPNESAIFLKHLCPRKKGARTNPMLSTNPQDKSRPHHQETTCPTLFNKCVGSSKSLANYVMRKMQEMGSTI